ncbi:MAG: hypothetical protein AB8H80_02780 [Planctomycetota bacterium]
MTSRYGRVAAIAGHLLRCCCVALPPAALAQSVEIVDERLPQREALVTSGDEVWLQLRLVDAMTGESLASGEVLLIDELPTPVTGEFHYEMRAEADSDGYVAMRVDAGAEDYRPWGWMLARSDGYCSLLRRETFADPIVRLVPAVPLRLQIRNWRGQPVPGALVGHCDGCGHTPDLVHGVTGPDGVVDLPSTDTWRGTNENYVVHPDLGMGYTGGRWRPGAAPLVLDIERGRAHEGRVVDHRGRPVAAGAFVGAPAVHRGPWTRTRDDGSFQLCGLGGADDLEVRVGDRRYLFARQGTKRLRLELPNPAHFAPHADGMHHVERTEVQRPLRSRQAFESVAKREARRVLGPRVVVRTVGLPADGRVRLCSPDGDQDIDDAIARGEPVVLPDTEFVFELSAQSSQRYLEIDRERAQREGRVRLHWFAPTMLEGQVRTASGEPARFEAAIVATCTDVPKWRGDEAGAELASQQISPRSIQTSGRGALSLPTELSGSHWLIVRRRLAGSRQYGVRILPIELPERGDRAVLDVGTIIIPDEPQHQFVNSEGAPLSKGAVRVLRAGWCNVDRGWRFDLDDDGRAWLPDLRPGDALLVTGHSVLQGVGEVHIGTPRVGVRIDLPARFVIGDTARSIFKLPAGGLLFEVDAGGETAFATIGDQVVALKPGTVTLVGRIPAEYDYLAIAAPGRKSAVVGVTAQPGAWPPRVRVRLPVESR